MIVEKQDAHEFLLKVWPWDKFVTVAPGILKEPEEIS